MTLPARVLNCFRLQHVPTGCPVNLTPFGRAIIDTGNLDPAGLDAPDRYYRLYWLRLPIFDYRYRAYTDDHAMQQAMLVFHGREGFRVVWVDPIALP